MKRHEEFSVLELPQSVLVLYPQLAELADRRARHLALAVYYYNRSVQEVLNTMREGRAIRGLTVTWVEFVLDDVRRRLRMLTSIRDAHLVRPFVTQEEALLAENCKGWYQTS